MSISKWSTKSAENEFNGLVTALSPIAIPMEPDNTLFLANIGKQEITPSGKEKQEVVRDNKSYAKSQFALCALKNTYAVPGAFIKKVAMVFTLYHIFFPKSAQTRLCDRGVAWIKDFARIPLLLFAWPVLILTPLFAAIYPSARLRNAVAALENGLLEDKDYDILKAMPAEDWGPLLTSIGEEPIPSSINDEDSEKDWQEHRDELTTFEQNKKNGKIKINLREIQNLYYPSTNSSTISKGTSSSSSSSSSPSLSSISSTPMTTSAPVQPSTPSTTVNSLRDFSNSSSSSSSSSGSATLKPNTQTTPRKGNLPIDGINKLAALAGSRITNSTSSPSSSSMFSTTTAILPTSTAPVASTTKGTSSFSPTSVSKQTPPPLPSTHFEKIAAQAKKNAIKESYTNGLIKATQHRLALQSIRSSSISTPSGSASSSSPSPNANRVEVSDILPTSTAPVASTTTDEDNASSSSSLPSEGARLNRLPLLGAPTSLPKQQPIPVQPLNPTSISANSSSITSSSSSSVSEMISPSSSPSLILTDAPQKQDTLDELQSNFLTSRGTSNWTLNSFTFLISVLLSSAENSSQRSLPLLNNSSQRPLRNVIRSNSLFYNAMNNIMPKDQTLLKIYYRSYSTVKFLDNSKIIMCLPNGSSLIIDLPALFAPTKKTAAVLALNHQDSTPRSSSTQPSQKKAKSDDGLITDTGQRMQRLKELKELKENKERKRNQERQQRTQKKSREEEITQEQTSTSSNKLHSPWKTSLSL